MSPGKALLGWVACAPVTTVPVASLADLATRITGLARSRQELRP